MEQLGRFPLSVILSFLSETEGTSLLITKRRFAYELLPVFQLRDAFAEVVVVTTSVGGGSRTKRRHRFIVLPAQDPNILLARLNTRRLFQRKEPIPVGRTTVEIAREEWQKDAAPRSLELLRFLDRSFHGNLFRDRGITFLVSYPRSGNTLARSLLERATGFVTGSDTRPNFDLSRELAERHDLVGEGVHQAVAFVKSHWPERSGNRSVVGQRAVLVVRNPYDAVDSYWNMCATLSHTQTVTDDVYDQFRDKYEALVRNDIRVWLQFHHYWLTQTPIPVLVVRYEDLVQNPTVELTRMLQFALGVDTLSDYWMRRVLHVTGDNIDRLGSYRPRHVRVGKALLKPHYTDELVDYVHRASEGFQPNYLRLFGYDVRHNGFPDQLPPNCESLRLVQGDGSSSAMEYVTINDGCTIRPLQCPYGRGMRTWRRSITDDDRNPLPTTG